MRFLHKKKIFNSNDKKIITEGVRFIEDELKASKTNKKLMVRSMLLSEEILVHLLEAVGEDSDISISIRRLFSDTEIVIKARGQELIPTQVDVEGLEDISQLGDEDLQMAIRAILLKSQGEQLKFSYKNGINQIRIMVGQAKKSMLVQTVRAMVLGLIIGLALKHVASPAVTAAVCHNVLEPIKTIFMNALQIIIAPVVFFSIVTCFSQYKNIREIGRIGIKVMGMYTMTTVIAVCLSMAITNIATTEEFGFAKDIFNTDVAINVDAEGTSSVLETIVGIVPANFLSPFIESNTLQIIFLAVLCGLTVGMIGEYSKMLQDFFEACNSLFLTITSLITQFIPLAVFSSLVLIISSIKMQTLASLLGMIGKYLMAIASMLIVYGLLILIFTRLDPIRFYKNNREGMITGFTLASSNAAMPTNIRNCVNKMGIAPKIANFSIPLGATVNMDGTSIFLTIMGLFLARAYGVEVPSASLVSLAITIILLSLGSPGVPGGSIVCLGVVLPSIGVPIEGIGLILAIYPFMDMFNTMLNTTGDVAVAVIVAKSEKSIDTDIFYGQSK